MRSAKGIDVDKYYITDFSDDVKEFMRQSKRDGYNIKPYINKYFDILQAKEVRLGLEHGVDPTPYANELLAYTKMREIRLQLESNSKSS